MLLTSPFTTDRCEGLEGIAWRKCQPRIMVLGVWNPIPVGYVMPETVYPNPPDFGYYALEK